MRVGPGWPVYVMTLNEDERHPRAATVVVPEAPTVQVEQASDGDDRVLIEGVMLHDGLNMNAWGLTEQGAQTIADSLVGRDVTASHPPLRDGRYDRSMHGGQGAPIGEVIEAGVTTADQAMLRDGGYTATYIAEILDPTAKAQFEAGLRTGDEYGVSVGIYGNPDDAVCSVCRDPMDACGHDRFEEVSVGDDEAADEDAETEIAGPLYNDGQSDHLASVFLPAYDGADVSVAAAGDHVPDAGDAATASGPGGVPEAATQLGAPFDADTTGADGADGTETEAETESDAETTAGTGPAVGGADDYYVTF